MVDDMNRYSVEFDGFNNITVEAYDKKEAIEKAYDHLQDYGYKGKLISCNLLRDYRLINPKTTRLNRCVFSAICTDIATILSFKGDV